MFNKIRHFLFALHVNQRSCFMASNLQKHQIATQSTMASKEEIPDAHKDNDSNSPVEKPDGSDNMNSNVVEQVLDKDDATDLEPGKMYKNKGPLSNRAYKRLIRVQKFKKEAERKKRVKNNDEPKDLTSISEEILKETSYYFENGLRKVYPYHFTFSTHVKGRWVGRTALDVFMDEFRQDSPENYRRKIEEGKVTVNGEMMEIDYKFKHNDLLQNIAHRHEVPVTADKIHVLENDDKVVVVNKPSSIPVHPCGRYRHNSLTFILTKELNLLNLRTIYRLDRLTSGVMIFAKTEEQARHMQNHILERKVKKQYLAQVLGTFPSEVVECNEPLNVLSHKVGVHHVDQTRGKESKTTFKLLYTDGKTSILLCAPHTGRTHQIRVHLQYLGYPIVNDPLYNLDIWGPLKGKGGNFGDKTKDEVIKELMDYHSREKHISSNAKNAIGSVSCNQDSPPNLAHPNVKSPSEGFVHEEVNKDEIIQDHGADKTDLSTDEPDCKKAKYERKEATVCQSSDQACSPAPLKKDFQGNGALDPNDLTIDEPCCKKAKYEEGEATTSKVSSQSFDPTLWKEDPHCQECAVVFDDPSPQELVMHLHAYSYRGPDWHYSTPVPEWAKVDGFQISCNLEKFCNSL